jgi:EAL domain-containing protein (putative c-di-GMP-specific phosphodiesterase class I)
MHEAVEQRAQLEEDLRHALLHREFVLAYQPVIELATGRLRGVEALIRWHHPQRGLVSPLDFIPVAEDSGLIAEIGTWVLREACIQGAAWRSLLEDDVPFDVAINISGHQLAPQLAETVLDALTTAGMRAVDVILEMTESTLMKDSAANLEILHQLRGLGVKLAIDDFGTGYSSLSYLRQFPVDILKIDKSFIDGIHGDANESAVARAVLKLSQTMHLTTIAEGIENQQQYDVLVRLGCPLGQGFLMSRPVPAEQITSMIRDLQLASATR